MKPLSTAEARSLLFQETNDSVSVYRKAGWQGCVLDGDKYGIHHMPRLLWDLITTCCNAESWLIYGYRPVGEADLGPTAVKPVWEGFNVPGNPAVASPEWLALDESCDWAVLAEFDVTLFGCSEELAVKADKYLQTYGTSFRQLSEGDFPSGNDWAFFRSVFANTL